MPGCSASLQTSLSPCLCLSTPPHHVKTAEEEPWRGPCSSVAAPACHDPGSGLVYKLFSCPELKYVVDEGTQDNWVHPGHFPDSLGCFSFPACVPCPLSGFSEDVAKLGFRTEQAHGQRLVVALNPCTSMLHTCSCPLEGSQHTWAPVTDLLNLMHFCIFLQVHNVTEILLGYHGANTREDICCFMVCMFLFVV